MTEQEREQEEDRQLHEALMKLAVGATVEEIGKDENGNTKIFKRKLAPDLDAIKYIRESKKKIRTTRYDPCLTKVGVSHDNQT
jgi:hypothetical protein